MAGRPPDFQTLYRAEFPYVWKTLRRLGAPAQDLEDLAHDLFVVVHRHLGQYDPSRPMRPWLFGIAVRIVADYRRSSRMREIPDEDVDPADAGASAHDKLEQREARALLMRALDTLDLDRRAVFVMHELDDTAMPQIAESLGIPLNTAYSRLRLARADVGAWIERFRGREAP